MEMNCQSLKFCLTGEDRSRSSALLRTVSFFLFLCKGKQSPLPEVCQQKTLRRAGLNLCPREQLRHTVSIPSRAHGTPHTPCSSQVLCIYKNRDIIQSKQCKYYSEVTAWISVTESVGFFLFSSYKHCFLR